MKKTFLCGVVTAVIALTAAPGLATDFGFSPIGGGLSQEDFKSLSKEAGTAFAYRNVAPATPLGFGGFDIGGEVSGMNIEPNSTYWNKAFTGNAPSYLVVPKVRARVGLPFGIDVGAMYSSVPNTNAKLYGAELSKSILDGSIATPAVGIRATYTKLDGVQDLALRTYGIDASISKGFPFITPYGGAGVVLINSEAKGNLQIASTPKLTTEDITVPRFFGGVVISPLPLIGITAEAEYAVRPIYSLKAALRF